MSERRRPRIYIAAGLAPGAEVEIGWRQAHHLRSVLRLELGSTVSGFNPADGEWLCRVEETGKSIMWLTVQHQLRVPEPQDAPGPWLLFAPIKRARLDWLVEKATELGVSALLPVWTAHTQAERVNLERMRAHAIEAAEQSERLSIPELRPPEKLERLLAAWPPERRLIICDETGGGEMLAETAAQLPPGPAALLVGPEGGFDRRELDAIAKLSFVTRVGLGPRVLRAETAALAALAVYQAIAGDWRRARTR